MVGVITAVDSPAARVVLGLGTAATNDSSAFATAAQGALADTALQDATAFATAAQGALADTALQDATAFATAAQGALADTALQDATAFATAAQGALADTALQDATAFATAAQGTKADGALQAANDLSDLNDAATARTNLGLGTAATTASTDYATAAQGALADTALQDATAFATAAQGLLADSAQQPPIEGAFADGDKTKLDGIEALADVTDATNVLAAGAVMTTGDQTVAGAKTFSSTIVGDINGNAATATTLATARNIAGNAFDGSGNITIAAADLSDVTDAGSGAIITDSERTKLTNIETSADVTDATNVLAAGAVMTTGDQTVAGAKTFSSTIVGDINGNAATATTLATARNIAGNAFDGSGNITIAAADLSDVTDAGSGAIITDSERTKLTNIETSADVTDATNVLAAGAVMTTGDQTVAGAKTFSSTIVGDINGNAATATTLATARNIAGNAFDGSGNITIAAADLSDVTDAGSGAIITDSERTKLTNIETSADVTDATNVLAAGAVMTTGDQTVAGAKTFSSTIVGDINGNAATATTLATARNIAGNAFDGSGNITIAAADLSDVTDAGSGAIITDSERTKLTNIETSADVTDATNVLAAGAVMTTGDQTVAGAKTFSSTIVGDINGNAATATTLATARNIAGNAFDGSGNITIAAADLSDVTDAGSGAIITDSERTKLTNIETSADVTDATNVLAAGAVMTTGDQTVAGAKTFSSTIVGDINGNAATATTLATARNIGGVSFDGTADIDLPGVNTAGNQDTSGNAATATAINTSSNGFVKTTNGNGTLSIGALVSGDIPNNAADTSGNAATVTNGVYTTGDQTISGAKTFSSTISGSIDGNAATVTVNSPASDSVADIDNGSSTYSSTAVIGTGSRTFTAALSSGTRVFNAGINLLSTSVVTITPTESAYFTSGDPQQLQLVVEIDHTNDTFTVKCYWRNVLRTPSADFKFNFIAIK